VTEKSKKTICIISPGKNVYSETFIKAHIDLLPAKIFHLYGGYVPRFIDANKPIYSVLNRRYVLDRVFKLKVLRKPMDWIIKEDFKHFLQQNPVDAVLAEYGPVGVAVMDICEVLNIPLIAHFHGADAYDDQFLSTAGRKYPALFKKAEATIAVSRDMEKQLLRLGAIPSKLHYNPYGVNTDLFSEGDPASAPVHFTFVGRFTDKKAPHLLILVFYKVLGQIPDARLKMVGDGTLLEACKQLVQALGIEKSVDFLGVRPPSEVAELLRHSRAFVQHSVRTSSGDCEGTPNTVLEAGASGLPVIATRHAGICDVVLENETGLLVDEKDIGGMANHMVQLANDPVMASRLGSAARKRICSEFGLEKSINNLWDIINAVI